MFLLKRSWSRFSEMLLCHNYIYVITIVKFSNKPLQTLFNVDEGKMFLNSNTMYVFSLLQFWNVFCNHDYPIMLFKFYQIQKHNILLNPFSTNVPLLYPLRYKSGTLVEIGLIRFYQWTTSNLKLSTEW